MHSILTKADFSLLPVRIDTVTGDGYVDMGGPVEAMTGAENADIQRPFAVGVQQVIHR